MSPTERLRALGVLPPEILLPAPGIDLSRWAVVACDQFTSEPDYWRRVEETVGDAPSTLRLIYPEAFLSEGEGRIPAIHRAMGAYLEQGVFAPPRQDFLLVERQGAHGSRLGLMMAVDLEQYDFAPEARSAIRPTEGTILDRLPPRVRIRQGGLLELPHIMLLVNDPAHSLIRPLSGIRERERPCYDVELMLGGGRLRGWWLPKAAQEGIAGALEALSGANNGLLFAVGDGNHSLATARQCWLSLRETLDPAGRENHPARWALVEVVNLYDPALTFEPIHRALFGVNPIEVMAHFEKAAYDAGLQPQMHPETPGESGLVMLEGDQALPMAFRGRPDRLPLAILQDFLDEAAKAPGASVDYIHGETALRELARRPGTLGFLLDAPHKEALFPYIERHGVLPRKAFSMGEAQEKRYYMEARRIL